MLPSCSASSARDTPKRAHSSPTCIERLCPRNTSKTCSLLTGVVESNVVTLMVAFQEAYARQRGDARSRQLLGGLGSAACAQYTRPAHVIAKRWPEGEIA